jgi:hypothetical protein
LPVLDRNFDNVAESFLTLFEVGSLDAWSDVMYAVVDSNGIDMQPIRGNATGWIYFFVAFMVLSNFLAVNFFVSAVCDQFIRAKSEIHNQLKREWMKKRAELIRLKPRSLPLRPAESFFRGMCFDMCQHPYFESTMIGLIIVQSCILASQSFGESTRVTTALYYSNAILAWVFAAEGVCKISGLGLLEYLRDNWNRCVHGVVGGFGGWVAL